MEANDLINPLRYANLGNINPANIKDLGDGVFPEPSTLSHLAILDLVTKAYQAVHLPTYGRVIPEQTNKLTKPMTDSDDTVELLTVPTNQTWKICGISAAIPGNYELTSAALAIDNINILNITDIDTLTATFGGVFVDVTKDIIVTGGATLSFKSAARPNATIGIQVLYDIMQI